MLKQLRVKFIALTMAMVAAVLVVAFSTICFTEYQRSLTTLQNALQTTVERSANLADNAESFDGANSFGTPPAETPDAYKGISRDARAGSNGGFEIGGAMRDREALIPMALFTLDETGELTPVEGETTAYLASDALESITATIRYAPEGFGYDDASGLYYLKRFMHGNTYVAMADDSSVSSWKSLALTLALVGLGTLLVFFVLCLFLSKWALKPVDEAWKAQRQFVTDASHELKTPLTVILANTAILLKHPERTISSQSKWLESTQAEALSMEGLVTEMLTLAQVESRPTVNREQIELSELVNGQLLQLESVAFESGFALEGDIEDNVVMQGDVDRIRKLVSTLIENASKYVNSGGLVRITLGTTDKYAIYTVFNTGSVIAPEDLPHVFDRFYRADKARTDGIGGFGLGLAIAREIARDHQGDIVAQSDPETGTTFTATIALR